MIGIWNSVSKRFVYGIKENTEKDAWKKFKQNYPNHFIPWRYVAKEIPDKWINPKNHLHRQ